MVIDDKGATVLTVFGLPPFSHENNSVFAIRAALKLQTRLSSSSFSIGLTTGSVFNGVIGSRKRCDHTILGEPVNLAARMMCSPLTANNQIMCDLATQKAAEGEVDFIPQEPQHFFKNSPSVRCFLVRKAQKNSAKSHFITPSVPLSIPLPSPILSHFLMMGLSLFKCRRTWLPKA